MRILSQIRTRLERRFKRKDFRARFPDVVFGEGVILRGEDNFFPGKRCSIDVRTYLNCAGGSWNGFSGYIKLGDGTEIGANCVISGAGGLTIGKNVHIGALTTISAHQFYRDPRSDDPAMRMQFAPVTVEDCVLIGPSCCITPGVVIGRNSIVGAGSTVVSDVPPNSVVQGIPARLVIQKRERDASSQPAASGYVDLAGVLDAINRVGQMGSLGPDDDFYEAGFSSINALMLLMELEERFHVSIPDERFISARTPRALQQLVTDSQGS